MIHWISFYLVSRWQVWHAFIILFLSVPWQWWRNARIHLNYSKLCVTAAYRIWSKAMLLCYTALCENFDTSVILYFKHIRRYPHVQGLNVIFVMPRRCLGMVGSIATLKLLNIKYVTSSRTGQLPSAGVLRQVMPDLFLYASALRRRRH